MSQDELWLPVSSAAAPWAEAGAVQRQIRPMLAARAKQRRDVMLRPINRSVLAQAHVLGELLVAADIEHEEVRKLSRRAATSLVVEPRISDRAPRDRAALHWQARSSGK